MLVTVMLLLRLKFLKDSMFSEQILSEISSLYLATGIQLGHTRGFLYAY